MTNENKTPNLIDKDKVLEWLKPLKTKAKKSAKDIEIAEYSNGRHDSYEEVETFLSSLPLQQVEQGAAKELRCDVFGCSPSVIITTPFGTFCQEHVKYTKA